jgi:hypothetical protein
LKLPFVLGIGERSFWFSLRFKCSPYNSGFLPDGYLDWHEYQKI